MNYSLKQLKVFVTVAQEKSFSRAGERIGLSQSAVSHSVKELASFFPARGDFVPFFENLTTAAIAMLFFMHGAKLSREAIIAGGGHWRLHLWVMCSTFVLFPILGVLFAWWKPVNVDPMLYSGFLYLCILSAP